MAFRLLIFNNYLSFLLITVTLNNISFKIDSGFLYRSGGGGGALGSDATITILNDKKKNGSGC